MSKIMHPASKKTTTAAPQRRMGAAAALLTLSGASRAAGQVLPTETTGCLIYGQSVRPKMGAEIWNVESRMDCQAQCQQNPNCGKFRYHEDTKGCQLAPQNSWYINDAHCQGTYGDHRCVAGPRACASIPQWCNEVPDATRFPADTQLESNKAWSVGIQPPNMQCWPHGSNEWPRLCAEEPVTVLEDSQTGWSGLCQGLQRVDSLPEGKTCADVCKDDLWCSEWALVRNWRNEEQCWTGLGDRCYKTHGYEGQLVQAQRIMHGHFRVLRDLRYAEVDGLVHMDVSNEEGIAKTAETDGITRCKNTCLSLVNCQIWIYHRSSGCWIEWPYKHRIKYPATTSSWGIAGSQDVIAGEYMQRVCGNLSGDVTSAPVAPVPAPPPAVVLPLPTVCVPNNTQALTAPCQCASNVDTNECMMGMYCWVGNTCSNSPKESRTVPDENTNGVVTMPEDEEQRMADHVDDIVRVVSLILLCLLCCGITAAGVWCMTGRIGRFNSASTLLLVEAEEDNKRQENWVFPSTQGGLRPSATIHSRAAPLVMAAPAPVAASPVAQVQAAPMVAYSNYPRAGAQQGVYAPVATSSASRGMVEVPAGTPGAFPMMEYGSGAEPVYASGALSPMPTGLPTLRLGGARDPRSVFDMMDTNHDGFVTKEEWDRFGMP